MHANDAEALCLLRRLLQGLTAACGKWAPAVAARLHRQGLACHVLDKQARSLAAPQLTHAHARRDALVLSFALALTRRC